MVNELAYIAPSLIKKAFLELNLHEDKFEKVMDLGCGTGLAGVEFRDIAGTLIGIDLSENMVRMAKKKNIYDKLYVADLIDGLESLKTKFDLYISTDVFIYIGDLLPYFHCVKKHSNKDSLFIFSVEHTDSDGFELRKTCRYAHSKDYVLSVAAETGFELKYFKQSDLRKEGNIWIGGGIYVLKNV